ncbi:MULTISPECIES: transposase zinc-binding domain-containing protein [Sorangium]|uniref:transposase zinc-binding domain-containing protein n=1 Tax=Sorangium TaxID=39643 RepID=UPI003D9C42E4
MIIEGSAPCSRSAKFLAVPCPTGGTSAVARDPATAASCPGSAEKSHCDGCGHDVLVAFSCKHRGPCPSCASRRMCDEAATLVDRILPNVPVRPGAAPEAARSR